MEKDPLPRWRAEFAKFRSDICNLLLSAHIYEVVDDALRTNGNVDKEDPLLAFLDIWYYQYLSATVRRHVKYDPQSHGLIRLLRQVQQRPEVIPVTPEDVEWDLKRLEGGTKDIEAFADRTVAHLDRRGRAEEATVKQAADAVKVLGSVFNKYEKRLLDREPFDPRLALAGQWRNALDVPWRAITVLPNKPL